MDLDRLRRHWNELARRDPLWAVMTWEDKAGGGWSDEEFFATGRDEMAAWMRRLGELRAGDPVGGAIAACLGGRGHERAALPFARALDFGCGVGRMTQALCGYAWDVTGVDISPVMLERAAGHNRFGERVRHVRAEGAGLERFREAEFDLVHSCYVLQHMHPRYGTRCLAELLRVLRPGGTLLVQVAADHLGDATLAEPRTAWVPPAAELRAVRVEHSPPRERGPRFSLRRRLEKLLGTHEVAGREPIRQAPLQLTTLNVRAINASGCLLPAGPSADGLHQWKAGVRLLGAGAGEPAVEQLTRLPYDLGPGQSTHLHVRLSAPPDPGEYRLAFDLHDEGLGWLHDPSDLEAWPLHVAPRAAAHDGSDEPEIQMYCLPGHVVRGLVEDGGGDIEAVVEDRTAGPAFAARRYWIRKR